MDKLGINLSLFKIISALKPITNTYNTFAKKVFISCTNMVSIGCYSKNVSGLFWHIGFYGSNHKDLMQKPHKWSHEPKSNLAGIFEQLLTNLSRHLE